MEIEMWKELIFKAEEFDAQVGYKPRPPATEGEIAKTIALAKDMLNVDLPKEYIEFLRFRNGYAHEGLVIYCGGLDEPVVKKDDDFYRDIVDANVVWRDYEHHEKYLYFGDADLYLYGLNLESGQYEQQDRTCGDVLETYSNFFQMIEGAMKVYYPAENK
jgi:hypothetical protein